MDKNNNLSFVLKKIFIKWSVDEKKYDTSNIDELFNQVCVENNVQKPTFVSLKSVDEFKEFTEDILVSDVENLFCEQYLDFVGKYNKVFTSVDYFPSYESLAEFLPSYYNLLKLLAIHESDFKLDLNSLNNMKNYIFNIGSLFGEVSYSTIHSPSFLANLKGLYDFFTFKDNVKEKNSLLKIKENHSDIFDCLLSIYEEKFEQEIYESLNTNFEHENHFYQLNYREKEKTNALADLTIPLTKSSTFGKKTIDTLDISKHILFEINKFNKSNVQITIFGNMSDIKIESIVKYISNSISPDIKVDINLHRYNALESTKIFQCYNVTCTCCDSNIKAENGFKFIKETLEKDNDLIMFLDWDTNRVLAPKTGKFLINYLEYCSGYNDLLFWNNFYLPRTNRAFSEFEDAFKYFSLNKAFGFSDVKINSNFIAIIDQKFLSDNNKIYYFTNFSNNLNFGYRNLPPFSYGDNPFLWEDEVMIVKSSKTDDKLLEFKETKKNALSISLSKIFDYLLIDDDKKRVIYDSIKNTNKEFDSKYFNDVYINFDYSKSLIDVEISFTYDVKLYNAVKMNIFLKELYEKMRVSRKSWYCSGRFTITNLFKNNAKSLNDLIFSSIHFSRYNDLFHYSDRLNKNNNEFPREKQPLVENDYYKYFLYWYFGYLNSNSTNFRGKYTGESLIYNFGKEINFDIFQYAKLFCEQFNCTNSCFYTQDVIINEHVRTKK